ncbi:MAG: hypothetical protein ACE5DI_01255 [Candidatus Micrarchaeia archaeon]
MGEMTSIKIRPEQLEKFRLLKAKHEARLKKTLGLADHEFFDYVLETIEKKLG